MQYFKAHHAAKLSWHYARAYTISSEPLVFFESNDQSAPCRLVVLSYRFSIRGLGSRDMRTGFSKFSWQEMRVEAEKLEDEFWQDLEKYRISESNTVLQVLQSQPESC